MTSGAAFVSVLTHLSSLLDNESISSFGLGDELLRMSKMRAVIEDDEKTRSAKNHYLMNWVSELTNIAFYLEELIDNFKFKIVKQRWWWGFSAIIAQYVIREQMKRIRREFNEIAESRVAFDTGFMSEIRASPVRILNYRRWVEPDVVELDLEDEQVKTLVGQLIGGSSTSQSQLEVISLVGMGGSGKTTLAKKLFHHIHVKKHFQSHAFVSISRQHRARDLLQEIAEKVMGVGEDEEFSEAGLFDFLKERRYFIVLDDLWKMQTWAFHLKEAFPDRMNGSRILVTTRTNHLPSHPFNQSHAHQLHPLNAEESWKLFVNRAFLQEGTMPACPSELEGLGKQIVANCGGFPLALVISAGFLSLQDKTPNVWSNALASVKWRLSRDVSYCGKRLALTYLDLPPFLKDIFLYFSFFPDNYEIPVKRLARLLVAEAFVQERPSKTAENVAKDYIEMMVCMGIVEVAAKSFDGRIKTCRIHDLLRELSVSEAKQIGFVYTNLNVNLDFPNKVSRLAIHHSGTDGYDFLYRPMPKLRSFLYSTNGFREKPLKFNFLGSFKVLRVLDMEGVLIPNFSKKLERLIHLRYLRIRKALGGTFSSSIRSLFNLQTLDLEFPHRQYIPNVFQKMNCLQHLCLINAAIDDYLKLDHMITLQTLRLAAGGWIEKSLSKLKGLKELRIEGSLILHRSALSFSGLPDLYKLHLDGNIEELPEPHKFPPCLTRLTLRLSQLKNNALPILEKLPMLQVLKLLRDSYTEKEIRCSTGGFCKLQLMVVDGLSDLEQWVVEEGAMSSLKQLKIDRCESLKMIPEGLQHVTSLKQLEFNRASEELKERTRENVGDDWYKICRIPSVVIT